MSRNTAIIYYKLNSVSFLHLYSEYRRKISIFIFLDFLINKTNLINVFFISNKDWDKENIIISNNFFERILPLKISS